MDGFHRRKLNAAIPDANRRIPRCLERNRQIEDIFAYFLARFRQTVKIRCGIAMDSARRKQGALELGVFGHLLEEAENLRCVVKDLEHRYLYVNRGWLRSTGFADIGEVLGKTAMDLFPAWRAERYMTEEREVIEHGRHFDYEEVASAPDGGSERWRSLKSPWRREGRIVGVTGLGMRIEADAMQDHRADVMPELVEWMSRHACEVHSIAELAGRSRMSLRSFERYFHETTGESPARYRLRCRIERAKALLCESGSSILAIAMECGFADQSHFTRVFHKETGVSPGEWRKKG
jgi:PAS domain S-box-containing protein